MSDPRGVDFLGLARKILAMSSRPSSESGRLSRYRTAPGDQASRRAAQRDVLRHHIARIKNRCTVSELAKAESRTSLSLRIVLFADALVQAGMLGNVEDLKADRTELTVRTLLKGAFLGDARQVERVLDDVAARPEADQTAFCELMAGVGWRLLDGAQQPAPEVRAG